MPGFEVRDHIDRVSVGREDGIENALNRARETNESQTPEQARGSDRERGQGKSLRESESLVTQQIERQMESLANFALVIRGLRAEPEDLCAKLANLCVMVAKGTRLGSAAASPWNRVPAGRKRHTGTAGERIGVNHNQSGSLTEVDTMA